MNLDDLRARTVEVDGCWVWTACRSGRGYGKVGHNGRTVSTHRLAYELAKGPIPDGLQIDHLCRVRACCNPQHLEAVTPAENVLRGEGLCAVNAAKTECHKGHPFDDENTYRPPGTNRRLCRTCLREASRRYELKRKAGRAAA